MVSLSLPGATSIAVERTMPWSGSADLGCPSAKGAASTTIKEEINCRNGVSIGHQKTGGICRRLYRVRRPDAIRGFAAKPEGVIRWPWLSSTPDTWHFGNLVGVPPPQ